MKGIKYTYFVGLLAFGLSVFAQNTTIQHTCGDIDNGAVYINMILPAPNEPFTYYLIGPGTNGSQVISDEPIFENLAEGEYTVVVEDKDGCSGAKIINVEQGAHIDCCELILDASLTHTSLPDATDGSIDLSLSLGEGTAQATPYTYQWQGPDAYSANTEDISNLEEGEYCVWVTDRFGCTASLCVEIEAQQCVEDWIDLELKVYPTTHTDNADGRIDIIRNSVSRNVSYEWNGPSEIIEQYIENVSPDTFFAGNLSIGLYCLTINDLDYGCVQEKCVYVMDGCSLYENYTLLIGPNPESIRPETPISLGSIDGYNRLLEEGENTLPPHVSAAGSIIRYMQGTGEPWIGNSVDGFPAGVYCIKRSLERARSYGTGWGQFSDDICPENAAEYCFEIPYDPNPCATRTIEAEVVHNCMGNGSIPADGSITLQLSTDEYGWVEPITYQWDNYWESTTPQLTNLFNGTYCVTVSDAENCSKTECFEVGSNRLGVNVKSIVPYCVEYPGSIEIEVQGDYTPPLSYSWATENDYGFPNTFSSGSDVHDNLYTDTYCVRVEDADGCIFTQCGLEVSWEQVSEGSLVDGACYKEIYCGNYVVNTIPAGWEYEPIPETCNALILCNGVPTGGIQAGEEVDSWYEILDNRSEFTIGCTEDDPIFNCIGCVKWIECDPGGRSEIPVTEAFEVSVYDFDFVETECGEGEVVCGFCELQFKCPSTGEDITDEVRDEFGATAIRGNLDITSGIQVVSSTLCRVLMDCTTNKAALPSNGMDKWIEIPCPGGIAPPIDIEGHLNSSYQLTYSTIQQYFGLTILNSYNEFYQPIWNTTFEGTGIEVAQDLSLDGMNHLWTTGYFTGTLADSRGGIYTSKGDKDAFLIQHDNLGNEVSTLQISGFGSEEGKGLAIDNVGNIVVTGSYDDQISFDGYGMMSDSQNMFLAKFDGTGQFLWAKSGGGLGRDAGLSVATDAQDNIFVAGYYEGFAQFGSHTFTDSGDTTPELFVAKYDKTGELIWAKRAVSDGFEVEKVKVETMLSGGVAVFGEATGRLSFEDGTVIQGRTDDSELFLTHYDADGNLMWVNQLGNTPKNVRMGGIDVNDNGSLLINGSFEGSMVLQNRTLKSAGKSDIFVAQFAPNGNLEWARAEGSVLGEYAAAITAVKNTNQVAYTGRFYGNPILEGIQLQAEGDKGNNYVVGFGGGSAKQFQIDEPSISSLKRVYPNPFKNNFVIELWAAQNETTIVHLYDIQGKLILENSYDLMKGYNSIEVRPNTLSNGLYLLEVIYGNNQSMTTKLNRVGK